MVTAFSVFVTTVAVGEEHPLLKIALLWRNSAAQIAELARRGRDTVKRTMIATVVLNAASATAQTHFLIPMPTAATSHHHHQVRSVIERKASPGFRAN